MHCEFIQGIETWGSGGYMMDVVTLKDGRILVVADFGVRLYENRAAFDSGMTGTVLESQRTDAQQRVEVTPKLASR